MKEDNNKAQALAKFFTLIKTEKEFKSLINELMTHSEINKFHERIRVLERLKKGDSQRKAAKKSGAAIATVSRGALLMKRGQLIISDIIEKACQMSWWQALFWRV